MEKTNSPQPQRRVSSPRVPTRYPVFVRGLQLDCANSQGRLLSSGGTYVGLDGSANDGPRSVLSIQSAYNNLVPYSVYLPGSHWRFHPPASQSSVVHAGAQRLPVYHDCHGYYSDRNAQTVFPARDLASKLIRLVFKAVQDQ